MHDRCPNREAPAISDARVTTGHAEVDGAQLYYETAGTGHPLVWVHAGVADFHALGGLPARQIPGARSAVLPGAAHMLSLERPAEFNRVVMVFLAEHTPA